MNNVQTIWTRVALGNSRKVRLLLAQVVVIVLLLPPTSGAPLQLRAQPALVAWAESHPDAIVNVIVQKLRHDQAAEKAVTQLGGVVTNELSIINAFAAEMKAQDVAQLARTNGVRWISLDAPMQSTAVGDLTVRDEFGAVSYSNNDGTQNWATAWSETGDGHRSRPNKGSLGVDDGALSLSGPNRTLSREANLANAVSALLSFQYKRSGLDTVSDYIAVQISANGGTTWSELARYQGPGSDNAWQTATFDMAGYAAANTVIRFATSSTLSSEDSVSIDNVQIEYAVSMSSPPPPVSDGVDGTVDTSALLNAYNQSIKADQVWDLGFQGSAVTVAVVDSGINPNGDLYTAMGVNRQKADVRFNSDYNQNTSDGYGHGTHVASTVGGDGSESGGKYIGVAPMVNIINVKVSNDDGSARMQDVVLGLQWVLENREQYNIRVVNLSLNSSLAESYHTSPLTAAVEILWLNQIVVVASAGNQHGGVLYPPANDPFIITVGAADDKGTSTLSDDVIASFSSYGTTVDGFKKPDLIAPGTNIIARLVNRNMGLAQAHPSNKVNGGKYFRMSGTSMAAPIVSGAVALLLQDEPQLTPDQVKHRLMATANKTWPGYDPVQAGAGYLDIYAAVHSSSTESANTGIPVSNLLTTDPNGVLNSSVSWSSVSWSSVSWSSVSWSSDYWDESITSSSVQANATIENTDMANAVDNNETDMTNAVDNKENIAAIYLPLILMAEDSDRVSN